MLPGAAAHGAVLHLAARGGLGHLRLRRTLRADCVPDCVPDCPPDCVVPVFWATAGIAIRAAAAAPIKKVFIMNPPLRGLAAFF
jgi:hypothetical protein